MAAQEIASGRADNRKKELPESYSWIVPARGFLVVEEVFADKSRRTLGVPSLTREELRRGIPPIDDNIVFEVD